MNRIILYITIVMACGLCGGLMSLKYVERSRLLLDFINALERLRIEIEYRRESLPELFARIGAENSSAAGMFFRSVASSYKELRNAPLSYCWRRETQIIYSDSALEIEDIDTITAIGDELGGSGTGGQHRIIELHLIKLRQLYEEAEEQRKAKGKLCISLGFAIGVTIVVLLI